MGGIGVLKKEVMVKDIDKKYDHPLAEIVQIASQYRCEILLEYDKYRINAKSIMGIIAFNPSEGMNVTIAADGNDEDDAVVALEKFLQCQ
jgi:phosphocarrier protein